MRCNCKIFNSGELRVAKRNEYVFCSYVASVERLSTRAISRVELDMLIVDGIALTYS